MPTEEDTRHQQRLQRIQALFAWEFRPEPSLEDPQFSELSEIVPRLGEIDQTILTYAPKRQIADFNKMDLAILRQALYELMYAQTPPLVVINEAIEIAKQYGSDQSSRFVNGVLGNYWDERRKGTNESSTTTSEPQE